MDSITIDGQKLDFTGEIVLKYNNTLVSDIGNIVSNYTSTVKLPKTLQNLRLIECSHMVGCTSRFPYQKHKAQIIKNGVILVEDAYIVLLNVSESIEIALFWGNISILGKMKDKSLRDMDYTLNDFKIWEKTGNSKDYPLINYGFKDDESAVWYHPVVTASWILNKISESSGVKFDLSPDRQECLKELFIPLLERKDSLKLSYDNALELVPRDIIQTNFFRVFKFIARPKGDFYFSMISETTLKVKDHKTKIYLNGTIIFDVSLRGNNGLPNSSERNQIEIRVRNLSNNGTPVLADIPAEVIPLMNNKYRYKFHFDNVPVEIEPNDEIGFVLFDIYNTSIDSYTISIIEGDAGQLQIRGEYETEIGDRIYIVPNLPDIKQIDFIKGICSMLGLFAVPQTENTIKLVSMDILQDKRRARDWTLKLLKTGKEVISYKYSKFAQMNYFRYKDESQGRNDSSYIPIKDTTLEESSELVKLPFAATETYKGVAYIPLYSYTGKTLKFKRDASPRILKYQGVKGVFEDIKWDNLLAKYYITLKQILKDMKVLEVKVKLTAPELKLLDLTRPIYLRQYGFYFAIIKAESCEHDVAKCILMRID